MQMINKAMASEVVVGSTATEPIFSGISIDSRTIRPGELFFAIEGENNDGHDFIADAFARGAAGAVVNRRRIDCIPETGQKPVFAVDDTREAMLGMAAHLRDQHDARFAAITGSNGKTTTKEMFYSIVAVEHSAYRSPGNLNNLYGMPIALGRMKTDAEYGIFELGISVPGEMTRLATILKPETALITNIGPTHLETLKTIENVVKAKFELIDNLPKEAITILNSDDPLLTAEAKRRNLDFIGFGVNSDCRFVARDIRTLDGKGLEFSVNSQEIFIPAFGQVNVYNALGAIAASSVWGCGPSEWQAGLAAFEPLDMRLVVEMFEGVSLLIDCYNANPESVKASLQSFREIEADGKKIAVLGDMLELGETAREWHRIIGWKVSEVGAEYLLCIGEHSKMTVEGAVEAGMTHDNALHFDDHQALLNMLLKLTKKGDLVLFKGSRGMELERIVIGLKGSIFKSN